MRIGKGLFLKWMRWACMNALKIVGFRFILFGQLVLAHLERLRSNCAHSEYFWR